MPGEPNIKRISDMLVAYSTRNVVCPVPTDQKTITIAVTVPGGFTGFGADVDDACKMALSRAGIGFERAKKLVPDLTESAWIEQIWERYSLALHDFLVSEVATAREEDQMETDGFTAFKSPRVVDQLRSPRFISGAGMMFAGV